MNIEAYKPINTKEKIDEIIRLILSRQESPNIYIDIILHIQKVKIQLYFKEKFNEIKELLLQKKVSQQTQKTTLTLNAPTIENPLSYKEAYRKDLIKELGISVNSTSIFTQTKAISISKEKKILPKPPKEKKSPSEKHCKHALTIKHDEINIRLFYGMTIKQLSGFIGISSRTLSYIIKHKCKYIINLSDTYALTEKDIELLSDFLKNAYATKVHNDRKEEILKKEIETAGDFHKKIEEKFKPSLGREGNYNKLIYIPTKS